jgi:lipopolysaccharide exporter
MNALQNLDRMKSGALRSLFGTGLRAKAARGGAWVGGASFAEQFFRFARNMLLARLLAPNAFGAMAIVLSSSALVRSFSDVGVWAAIIQNPRGATPSYLNAAWWVAAARGLMMYAAVFVAAPSVGHFYGNPEISALLRLALLNLVFDGLLSPHSFVAQKEMRFGRWVFISNGGGICGVVLTIVLSFVLRDVWALAIGFASENAFRCLFSYFAYPELPSFKVDKHALAEIMHFSRGILGLSFLNLLFARTDIFVLAKLHSAHDLGIYSLAVNLVQTPATFLVSTLAQTLLPACSQIQADLDRLKRILIEVSSWVILCGIPVVVMIAICGSSLLTIFYGHRYAGAAATYALTFAAGVALLNTLNSLITNLFYSIGEPALHRRAVLVSAIGMVVAIYPSCRLFGLAGGQVAALFAISCGYLLQAARAKTLIGLKILDYGRAFIPATLVSAGVLLAGAGAHLLGLGGSATANIAIAGATCMFGFLASVVLFLKMKKSAAPLFANPK